MNRRMIGVIVAAVIVAAPLAACGSDRDKSATAVCVDAAGTRLPDSACDRDDSGNTLMWFLAGAAIGGVGTHMYGGSYGRPSGVSNYYYGGVPSAGGSVPKSGHFKSSTTAVPKDAVKPSARPSAPASPLSTSKPSVKPSVPSSKPSAKASAKPNLSKPKPPKVKSGSGSKPKAPSVSRPRK